MVLTLNNVWGDLGGVDISNNVGSPTYNETASPPDYTTRYGLLDASGEESQFLFFPHNGDAGTSTLVGLWWRVSDSTPTAETDFITFEDAGGSSQAKLFLETDGDLRAEDGAAGVIGTATTPFSDNTWHRIEVYMERGASSIFTCWVDGVQVIRSTTADLTTTTANRIELECPTTGTVNFASMYVYTDAAETDRASLKGDGKWGVKRYLAQTSPTARACVSGDGATLDSGAWTNVDEIPFVDGNSGTFTGGTSDSGAINYDDSTNGGPSGDAEVGTILGYKYVWRLSKTSSTTTVFKAYWGDENDAVTWNASRQKTVTPTTSAGNFYEVTAAEGPDTSEAFSMGAGQDGGGEDLIIHEMLPQLFFVGKGGQAGDFGAPVPLQNNVAAKAGGQIRYFMPGRAATFAHPFYARPSGADITRTPGTAQLTLTTQAPRLQFHLRSGAAQLSVTTQAPRLQHLLRSGTAQLSLTTQAPVVTQTEDILLTPGAAQLSITTQSPRLQHLLRSGTAQLSLTTQAPVITQTEDVFLTPGAAQLSVTTQAPRLQYVLRSGAAQLTLTTQAPVMSVSGDQTLTPGAAQLSLTTQAPRLGFHLRSGASQLGLTTQAPRLQYTLRSGAAQLSLTTQAPVLTQTENVLRTPGAAQLALSTQVPRLQFHLRSGAAQLALSTQAPRLQYVLRSGAAQLALSTQAPTITLTKDVLRTPGAAQLILSTQAPRLQHLLRSGAAQLSLTTQAPTVTVQQNILRTPGAAQLSLTTQAPTLTHTEDVLRTPGTGQLSLSTQAPTLTQTEDVLTTPGEAQLSLTTQAPRLQHMLRSGAAQLTLTTQPPAVTFQDNVSRTPGTAQLTLSPGLPIATVQIRNVSVTIPAAQLTITTNQPVLIFYPPSRVGTEGDADRSMAAEAVDRDLASPAVDRAPPAVREA